jgi:M6 family metalloprotease-like protein
MTLLPSRTPRRALAALGAGVLTALALSGPAHAAEKVTPDVTGTQRVLAVGCRFADTTSPDILNIANDGIGQVLQHTHNYFDTVSNHRVDFEGSFEGWHTLPRSSGDYSDSDGAQQTADCQNIAEQVLQARGERASDYAAVVLLFNLDRGISNQTWQDPSHPGTWIRLRFTGGTGGGWTSEALWAHEMGHAFGLLHTTFPTRTAGNQYNDFQDTMSGYGHSAQHRWNFPVGGICNGIAKHPRCIYAGEADNVPVHYSAFQKQRLGWLFDDNVATHWGGRKSYFLSAPTYNPGDGPTVEKLKMVEVKIPNSTAYYAIGYRRGDDGADSNASAYRRGWDDYEKGIRSNRVTVYLVEPDLYAANAGDLGDANLVAVLNPGDAYTAPGGAPPLTVSLDSIEPGPQMNANVTVTTPNGAAPQTVLSAAGVDGSWVNHDVSAYLFPLQGFAPLSQTYYGVDDGGCTTQTLDCAVYDGTPFTISAEGEHDVTFFSTDVTGQAEDIQHRTIRIDKTAPATGISVTGPTFTLFASDDRSGVTETDYAIDDDGFRPYSQPVTLTAPGDHVVHYRSVDKAENFEAAKSVTVHVAPTCSAVATHRRITTADGRMVAIHVTVKRSAGTKLVLRSVSRAGGGVATGWRTGTADLDGKVKAKAGASYAMRYRVTDAQGATGTCSARVTVAG